MSDLIHRRRRIADLGEAAFVGRLGSHALAGVSLSFPFFDGWKTKGRLQQARSDFDRALLEEAKLQRMPAADLLAFTRMSGAVVRALVV